MRYLTFVLRYEFGPNDGTTLELLRKDFMTNFMAAYSRLYLKPKHHKLKHLAKYFELYGPFRVFWTMHGEAFLQRLKRLFEACNYKSAPHSVVTMWAQRRALRGSAYKVADDSVFEWSSDSMVGPAIAQAAVHSQMLKSIITTPDHAGISAARYLTWFKRGPAEIEIGSWAMLTAGGTVVIARVHEISMITLGTGERLRL